ncbi:MAG: hypothetical protein AAFY57_05900 [Cyanobacteria bacterium J06642_2]
MTEWTSEVILTLTFNIVLAIFLFGVLPVVWKLRRTFRGVALSMTNLAEGLGMTLQPAPKGLDRAETSLRQGRRSLEKFKRSSRWVNGVAQLGQWAIGRWRR